MESTNTKRIIVPEAEEILEKEIKVLDKGFVRLVDYMGGDAAIVQAARVSYGEGTKKVSEDRGLIRYLMRHRHTTPFEMVEMKWHCKMPIFVARQWIRHRTANVNEYSLRYSEPRNDFYIPKFGEIRFQSVTNKQGGSEEKVPDVLTQIIIDTILSTSNQAISDYEWMNNNDISKELSRIVLPLNLYTEWYWKNDLHNTLHFLSLRLDKHAQYEIREYAKAMADIVRKVAPFAYEAFDDYIVNSVNFSSQEKEAIREIFSGKNLDEASGKLPPREKKEFIEKWDDIIENKK